MGMGIDVTRHYRLTGNVDDVICLIRGDVFGHQSDLAVPNPNVELTIDAVCRVNNATALKYRIEML